MITRFYLLFSTDSFLHDRIQLAAVQTMTPAKQQQTHFNIAKQLQQLEQQRISKNKEPTYQFDITNHFNAAIDLVQQDPQLSIEVSELNCSSAQLTKRSGSYATGLSYIQNAQLLLHLQAEIAESEKSREQQQLEGQSWNDHYRLCFDSCLIRWVS